MLKLILNWLISERVLSFQERLLVIYWNISRVSDALECASSR